MEMPFTTNKCCKSVHLEMPFTITDKYCKSMHLESLYTNIGSASVSNVNIVCYIYQASPTNFVSVTDNSLKSSMPATGGCAQTYKTCQHRSTKTVGCVHSYHSFY